MGESALVINGYATLGADLGGASLESLDGRLSLVSTVMTDCKFPVIEQMPISATAVDKCTWICCGWTDDSGVAECAWSNGAIPAQRTWAMMKVAE